MKRFSAPLVKRLQSAKSGVFVSCCAHQQKRMKGMFATSQPPPAEQSGPKMVRGKTSIDHKLDMASVRVGDSLEIPYEITVSDSWRDAWQSVFYQQDRLHTSSDFVKRLSFHPDGLIPIPFELALYSATSMSHVDDSRNVFDLAFRNCAYHKPIFPGETVKRHFKVLNIRESKSGRNIIIDLECKLMNTKDEVLFSAHKMMFFEKISMKIPQSHRPGKTPKIDTGLGYQNEFAKTIMANQSHLPEIGSLRPLQEGELILHTMNRAIGVSAAMSLATQVRMSHPALYLSMRRRRENVLVGGVPLLALAHASSAKDLYEILYQEVLDCHILNRCGPDESLGAMTYISSVNPISSYLEEVECVTVGIKGVDVTRDLVNVPVPLDLFKPGLIRREAEDLLDEHLPMLRDKVVVQSSRRLIRQIPENYHMPLL